MIDVKRVARAKKTGIVVGVTLGLSVLLLPAASANAATSFDGPIDLGAAATFSALGSSTLTNTGTSVLSGDIGVSPGTSITGFPPGVYNGTVHATDAVAGQAQADLTTAYNVAAGLSPTSTGFTDLTGLSLTPGVYKAETSLLLSGDLTLAGDAHSVWVFQVGSTLTTESNTHILLTGGASACNVYWQVGSSATLGSNSVFVGTIMAHDAITATTTAAITGRLLANGTAVTLDTNVIDTPTGCERTSPEITSSTPPDSTVGTPYSFTITATGTPTIAYTVSSGELPPGLGLNGATGEITGTPTTAGTFTFTVSADNGAAPAATATYTVTVATPVAVEVGGPGDTGTTGTTGVTGSAGTTGTGTGTSTRTGSLAATGENAMPIASAAGLLLFVGAAVILMRRRRAQRL